MVVLVDAEPGAGAVDPAAAKELAGLGVTSVSVVQDKAGLGVVLAGWAFDPFLDGQRAAAIIARGRARVRTLLPLLQTALSSERRSG